jgi:integrase/recombinase XerD
VVSFPCLVRSVSGLGEVRYALGDRFVDRYLEFVAGRARPNTLRAVAFDLKTFFTVICGCHRSVVGCAASTDRP